MTDSINVRFQIAGHPAASWTAGNPVILEREYAAETDTGKFKLGDGATAWNSLPYIAFWSSFARVEGAVSDNAALTTALGGKQPLDSDLTAIAALTTTSFGRALLELANAGALKSAAGLGNVDNTSDANKPVSTAQQSALDLKAPLASPPLTGTPTAPTASLATNSTQLATTAFVQGLVAQATTGLLDLKGDIDCSGNPNYPAALKGDAYVVSVAGKVGGASGISVDVGDTIIAKADNAGGTLAAVGASWWSQEHNIAGVLLAANNLSDVASAAAARTNLGLAIGTDVQAFDADLAAIAALATTSFGRSMLTLAAAADLRTAAALGSIATQSAASVAITGGSATGLSALRIGTGTVKNGELLTIEGGNGLYNGGTYAITDVASTIAYGAGLLLLIRDVDNGGVALVLYDNAQTPVIIAQANGAFVTGTPSGSEVQLLNRSGSFGVAARTATGQSTHLSVGPYSVDDA